MALTATKSLSDQAQVEAVVSDVLKLAAFSICIAIPIGLLSAKLLRAQTYDVSAADLRILLEVALLTILIALIAALVPAKRAAGVNPMEALRTE